MDKPSQVITSSKLGGAQSRLSDATRIEFQPVSTAEPKSKGDAAHRGKTGWWFTTIRAVGFSKSYNFILWFILAGALFGFTLARFQYLNFSIFCPADGSRGASGASPGECYWYQFPRYKVGIILHLATILPASLLVVLQFTPYIRKTFRTYHRIAGYTAVALGVISIAGVLMIADRSFGGAPSTQGFVGALSIAFLVALGLAVYNIRVKQIEQHRAWMIRAWVWAGSIISLRIIMIIAVQTISQYPESQRTFVAFSCNVLRFVIRDDAALTASYPTCSPVVGGTNTLGEALQVAVEANFNTGAGRPERIAAGLQACFPMAAWLALALHVVGTEVYLKLTPAEFERLRKISYEKQLERGMKNPGNGGLTVERLGDAKPWVYEQ